MELVIVEVHQANEVTEAGLKAVLRQTLIQKDVPREIPKVSRGNPILEKMLSDQRNWLFRGAF